MEGHVTTPEANTPRRALLGATRAATQIGTRVSAQAAARAATRTAKWALAILAAALLCLGVFATSTALADEDAPDYSSWTLDELKQEVDEQTAERDGLLAQSDTLTARLDGVNARLDEAYASIAGEEQLAIRSVKQRYKVQRQYPTLFDALLCAGDFHSFLAGIEYIEAASKVAVDGLVSLRAEITEQESEKSELESQLSETAERLSEVEITLKAATEARDEAQRKADLVANAHLEPDDADWDAGKDEFVDTWSERIDDYLEGSPLEGQGATFAKAAWSNRIDPRFSPAISTIESGKGRICIRPYNAWGWGAADPNPYGLAVEWSSWEEAIKAHVRGLARGYGYTVSPIGAQRYCPPNWELWYATVVSEMNSI